MTDVLIRPGGLMRCCILTIQEDAATAAELPTEGKELPCHYCSGKVVFRDGAWQWPGAGKPLDGKVVAGG